MRLFIAHDNGRTTPIDMDLHRPGVFRIYMANAGKPDRIIEIRVIKPARRKLRKVKMPLIFDDPC